jgi:hypothetical protein
MDEDLPQETHQQDNIPATSDPNTLYIDVNIGSGRKARIVMMPSDDPAVLAKNFAQVHNLDKVTQQ